MRVELHTSAPAYMLLQAHLAPAGLAHEPSVERSMYDASDQPAGILSNESSHPEHIALPGLSVKASSPLSESDDPLQQEAGNHSLSEEEQREVEELKKRDAEVKRHEQAHFRAGGQYASPPKYEYQTGPDGQRYAVGGSVEIDTSEIPGDPEATLQKARIIKRAALAPEEPSAQDRRVAREADAMATEAQQQMVEQRKEAPAPSDTKAPALTETDVASETTRKVAINIAFDETAKMLQRYKTEQLEMLIGRQLSGRLSPSAMAFGYGDEASSAHPSSRALINAVA